MDFGFTKEQKLLRDSIRDFISKECPREYVRELDEKGEYPFELYKKMADLEWYGIPFPEEYGGSGLGAVEYAIMGEELCRLSFEIGSAYGACIFNGLTLLHHGTEEQKKYYIPEL